MAELICPVIVGREGELDILQSAVDAASRGHGCCVAVSGEPGVGKSRILRELLAMASAGGMPTATGRALPTGINDAYRPFAEAVTHATRTRPIQVDADFEPWLPTLRSMIPTLHIDAQSPPQPRNDASSIVRGEAMLQVLSLLSESNGLVVTLEDMHWADPDSVAVLEYLADHISSKPVLIAFTTRSETPSDAISFVRRSRGRESVIHLALERLSEDDTVEMIVKCAPDADPELKQRVQRTSEGLPLLIEDLLASPGLPISFVDAVHDRLGEMTPDARAVIESAALLGRSFEWTLLEPITSQSAHVVSEALEHGVNSLLLTKQSDGFQFRHALTREAVLAEIMPARRRSLAASALSAVEGAHPSLPSPWCKLAADLALASGAVERATELYARSAKAALDRGALETAIQSFEQTLALAGDDPHITTMLVRALALAGRVDEAERTAKTLTDRRGLENSPIRRDAYIEVARAAIAASRWSMAEENLRCASSLISCDDSVISATITVLEAEVAFATGDVEKARSLITGVLASPDAEPDTTCHALEMEGRIERLHDLHAARAAFERALTTAETAGLELRRLHALHELGTIDMFDHCGTERLLEAKRLSVKLGALSTSAVLDLQLAAVSVSRWSPIDVEQHASLAIALAKQLDLRQVQAKGSLLLAEGYALRGDRAGTERCIAAMEYIMPNDRALHAFSLGARGEAALVSGDIRSATELIGQAAAIFATLGNAEPAAFRSLWPLLLAVSGDSDAASALEDARASGVGMFRMNRGLFAFAEAVLAGLAGEHEAALRLATDAQHLFINCEGWADIGLFLTAKAAFAGNWGEPERWLTQSAEHFMARGLVHLAARCQELRDTAPVTRWSEFDITKRESDVLLLVGEGLANKEIAAHLHLSPRTVEKHVESLFRKTGLSSRSQLAVLVTQGSART